MKISNSLVSAFLFATSNSNYDSNDKIKGYISNLSIARDITEEAKEKLLDNGNEKEAIALYEDAMIFGRKSALALHEVGANEANDAMDWLVSIYRSSALVRLNIGDIEGARKDAWGACMFSQSMDIPSQECMAEVCKASGDNIGHVQALKRIIELHDNKTDDDVLSNERIKEIKNTIVNLEKQIFGES